MTIFVKLIVGINFLKTKIPEIMDTGRTALPENIVHHLLYFVTITPDFAKDKEKILKAFEGQQQSQVTMAPLFTNVNDVVDSKRYYNLKTFKLTVLEVFLRMVKVRIQKN